jgi:hypothetical protein
MSKPQEIIVLVNELNNRVLFLFRHVFTKTLGIRPIITNDKEAFIQCTGAKFNYTTHRIADGLYIQPSGLLYQKGVKDINTNVFKVGQMPAIFASEDSDMPFDIFAAIFYMITRYEEYNRYTPDRHGRFQARESIFYKINFHEEPIVDIWIDYLKDFLKQRYGFLEFKKHEFQYLPTIDIDNAYAYKNKGLTRSIILLFRDLFTGRLRDFFYRYKVLMRVKDDPYDTFQYIRETLRGYTQKPVYFFLAGKRSKYDTNLPLAKISNIIKECATEACIGMHPSYASNRKFVLLEAEKASMDGVMDQAITKSRQHYLKLRMPITYQNLIKIGIHEDYSMGFAANLGFRAGTCHPYYFYDISREKETELRIIPFQAMDTTFKTYTKSAPSEAYEKLKELKQKVKNHGGTFCIVWHNETFAPNKEGLEWRKVFEQLLNNN